MQSRRNGNYWRERFRKMEEAQNERSIEKAREIQEQFDRTLSELDKKINVWYQRLADNNDVSLAEAKRILDKKELREFRWSVEEYIKYGKENDETGQWVKELENASSRVHIGWLEARKMEIRAAAEKLYGKYAGTAGEHIRNTYADNYYRTAYEIKKKAGIDANIQALDENMVEKIISNPWAVDGKNFSERIWQDKKKLINTMHQSFTRMCITGAPPDAAVSEIAKAMNASKKRAWTLVMTETAAFSNKARQECMNDLNVEEYEVVETLDDCTCRSCGEMDGKHYQMDEFEIGVTAPPFHPNCRGCTAPYFNDEFTAGEKRAARNETGNTYHVPSDMTYEEWKKTFVKGLKSELTDSADNSKIKIEGDDVSLEYQRYGRNKETVVNHTYINSGEYRNKFDSFTDNISVNRTLYAKAKAILNHRGGTEFEDMYWVDGTNGKVVASALNEKKKRGIQYTDAILKAISGRSNLIAFHNHPNSMPPSAEDFNSMLVHGYKTAFVVCHDGTIYQYISNEEISPILHRLYIDEFLSQGYSEREAQLKALEEIKQNHNIDFWEVSP